MAYGKIIIYGLIIISGLLYGEAKVVHTLPFRMSVPLFLCVFVSICTLRTPHQHSPPIGLNEVLMFVHAA